MLRRVDEGTGMESVCHLGECARPTILQRTGGVETHFKGSTIQHEVDAISTVQEDRENKTEESKRQNKNNNREGKEKGAWDLPRPPGDLVSTPAAYKSRMPRRPFPPLPLLLSTFRTFLLPLDPPALV